MNKVLTNINQDLSALEKQTARENIGAENASNRVTTIDENSTDTQYPSAKCVFGALQNVGGGYKDGGELVDGDFIKVENNTVSSYDNVSRDPVNFYFEVKDGDVLNSVVELTTAVNATINVYVVKNGFYYLLGNVGGNTVNAGDNYNLNVVGNSFMLEVVTPSQASPEYADIDGELVPVKLYNNKLWTLTDYNKPIGTSFIVNQTTWPGKTARFYRAEQIATIRENLPAGWDIPTRTDIDNLYSIYNTAEKLKSTSYWVNNPGDNSSGFNAIPWGECSSWGSQDNNGKLYVMIVQKDTGNSNGISFSSNGQSIKHLSLSGEWGFGMLRLVKNYP